MADLKTYERQSEAQITPVADVMTPAQQLIGTLRQFTDNRMKQAQDAANYNAAKAGTKAGSALGYQDRTPMTEADRAFNQAAQQAHQALIHTEIQTSILKAREEALNNLSVNSTNEFNAKVEGFSQGFLSQIKGEENQLYAKNLLSYYTTTNQLQVANAVRSLSKQISLANMLDYSNKMNDQIYDAIFNGDPISGAALSADKERKLEAFKNSGILSPAQYASMKEADSYARNEANYLGQFNRHLKAGKGVEAYNTFLNDEHKDLPVREKFMIASKMKSMANEYNAAHAVNLGAIKDSAKDLMTVALNTDTPEDEFNQKLTNAKAGVSNTFIDKPQELKSLNEDLGDAQLAYNVMRQVRTSSNAEIDQINAQIKSHVSNLGANLTENHLSNVNKLLTAIDSFKVQREKDPAAWAETTPTVQHAIEQYKQAENGQRSLTGDTLSTGGLPQQLPGKGQAPANDNIYFAKLKVQRDAGIPENQLSLVRKDEAAAEAAKINQFPEFKDRLGAIQLYLNNFPEKYQRIALNDLKNAGVSFSNLLGYRAAINPSTSAYAPQLNIAFSNSTKALEESAPKSTIKGLRESVRENLSSYMDSLNRYSGDPTQVRNETLDSSYNLALVFANTMSTSDAAKKAADVIINAHYDFSSMGGFQFMVPKSANVSTRSVQGAGTTLINNLKAIDLKVPLKVAGNLTEEQAATDYYIDIIRNGGLVMKPDETGMILVDSYGAPVISKDGKRYEFNFDNLLSPDSYLNQLKEVNTSVRDERQPIESAKRFEQGSGYLALQMAK